MIKQTGDVYRREIAWRSSFPANGRWGIPVMRKQPLVAGKVDLIAYSQTKMHDTYPNLDKGVHFFVDDYRFKGIYHHPDRSLSKLYQYRFVLTPDYSVYADMRPWMQMQSVAKGRWVGAYWQSKGLTVYPTISWGTAQTYEFCFKGYERGGTVAIATYACKSAKSLFLLGYYEMLRQLEPSNIICYGEPFPEMSEVNVVVSPYWMQKAGR